jgi:hypothetical protein
MIGTQEQRDAARKAGTSRVEAGLPFHKTPLERAVENPNSLRLAINAKCYDCIGQDADPDWRGSIRNCLCKDCPLYPVRPHQKQNSNDDES